MAKVILCRRVQHIFDEDAIAGSRIVYENVGYCAHQLAVLEDGTARHE